MGNKHPLAVGVILGSALTIVALLIATNPLITSVQAKPHKVDGENYASGRIPQEIANGKYPRSYFPGTEKIGKDEMRVTAIGTGMPTQTPTNKSA